MLHQRNTHNKLLLSLSILLRPLLFLLLSTTLSRRLWSYISPPPPVPGMPSLSSTRLTVWPCPALRRQSHPPGCNSLCEAGGRWSCFRSCGWWDPLAICYRHSLLECFALAAEVIHSLYLNSCSILAGTGADITGIDMETFFSSGLTGARLLTRPILHFISHLYKTKHIYST